MSRYIYLDDEPSTRVGGYRRAVQSEAYGLSIVHEHPKPYENQIQALAAAHKAGNLDGLILDLRLDLMHENDDPEKDKANYRAATLAQEIRTRATEGDMPSYPIVLWSTNEKLRKSYDTDDTSHDLFDLKSVKDDILDEGSAKYIAEKLVALAEGYKSVTALRKTKPDELFIYLGFNKKPIFLDERIYIHLRSQDGPLPTHEYARFIVRELLETAGPLVDKDALAARLGIDLKQSPGFDQLVETLFADAGYKGPFNGGWPNWWFAIVEEIWRNLPGCPGALRNLAAEKRVEFLKQTTGISEITDAKVAFANERTTFWTVCQATLRPLDPRDGYLIDKQPKYPWQDREYVSFYALLNRANVAKKIKIDALEEDRFKRAKTKMGL